MKKIILIFISWLVVVNLFTLFALNRVNTSPDTAYGWMATLNLHKEQTWQFLPIHARWDSGWYQAIVERGYYLDHATGASNLVFFPVYPFLVWVVTLVLNNFYLAGFLVSALALFGACIFLFKLVKEFESKADAEQAVVFLLIFPTAIFLNSIYTESLFIFFSVASFYFLFKKQYFLLAIVSFLAALTRVTGVLLFAPLLLEYFLQNRGKEFFKPKLLSLAAAPLGTFLFFLYHYLYFGDFLLFFKIEAGWGRGFKFNPDHFVFVTQAAFANFLLDASFVVFAIVLIILVAKKLRLSYALYMLLTLGVALSTGTTMSIGRYILVLFPMYIFAASIKNQYFKQLWVFVSLLLFSLITILFVHSHWAG